MQALQTFQFLTQNLLQSSSNKQLKQVQKQLLDRHKTQQQHQPKQQWLQPTRGQHPGGEEEKETGGSRAYQPDNSNPRPSQSQSQDQDQDQDQDQNRDTQTQADIRQQQRPRATMGMAKRYFVETTPGGRQQVVSIKRSRSYGGGGSSGSHHQGSRVRELDYIKVNLDEWNSLVDKERKLQLVNRSVVDESNALRSALLGAQAERKRLSTVIVPALDKQIASLTAENETLRRACGGGGGAYLNGGASGALASSGDAHTHAHAHPALPPSAMKKTYREEEKLRARIARLEDQGTDLRTENTSLVERNRSLQRQLDDVFLPTRIDDDIDVSYQGRDHPSSRSWRVRYLGLRKRYDELFDLLDSRGKKLRAYEDILERNGMV